MPPAFDIEILKQMFYFTSIGKVLFHINYSRAGQLRERRLVDSERSESKR